MTKRYLLYLLRWQMSTPILALFVYWFTQSLGATWTTVLANLAGGLIFFWVDLWIFRSTNILFAGELWEVKECVVCADCGVKGRSYRLIKAGGYDRTRDRQPQFRCHDCSRKKYAKMRPALATGAATTTVEDAGA